MTFDEYERDRKKGDRFLPEVKRILRRLVGPGAHIWDAGHMLDTKFATDLVVINGQVRQKYVAVRIRDFEFLERYPLEFTIRFSRIRGGIEIETEHSKFERGFGDWLFYGFSTENAERLKTWKLFDLDVFRNNWRNSQFEDHANDDDETVLRAYRWPSFPKELILAVGWNETSLKGEW